MRSSACWSGRGRDVTVLRRLHPAFPGWLRCPGRGRDPPGRADPTGRSGPPRRSTSGSRPPRPSTRSPSGRPPATWSAGTCCTMPDGPVQPGVIGDPIEVVQAGGLVPEPADGEPAWPAFAVSVRPDGGFVVGLEGTLVVAEDDVADLDERVRPPARSPGRGAAHRAGWQRRPARRHPLPPRPPPPGGARALRCPRRQGLRARCPRSATWPSSARGRLAAGERIRSASTSPPT